jgi:predicted nucleotidyltransferase
MIHGTKLEILAAFFPDPGEKTTKEIEIASGYSHERVHSILTNLERKGILKKRKVGKTSVFSIVQFSDKEYFAFLFSQFIRKEKLFKKSSAPFRAIEELIEKANTDITILFGSYAKDEQRKGSDVDLLCIGSNLKTEKIALALRHRYNIRITPTNVKMKEFQKIKTENPAFWSDLLNFGIVLSGTELFFKSVYK